MINKKMIAVIGIALLTSCSAKLTMPTDSDAARGTKKYNGITLSDLNNGKTLYEQKCTQCHNAKKPSSKSEEKWKKIVPEMAQKAIKKGKTPISESEQQTIIRYLVVMGGK